MSPIDLRSIRVSGADARSFLQGQLSADIDALAPSRPLLASCNSAQGRVQAVVWLTDHGEWVELVLPASMSERIFTRLRKYILRSKVTLMEQPGVVSFAPPHAYNAVDWRLAGIRAGLPQVYPETHEAFVAQMLNLDLLGGISFEKGCYTGQEIIARTHFRGAIKRRMFRFASSNPPPVPGTRILAGDQHAGDVVDAAATNEGSELLAVITLAQQDAALELETNRGATLTKLPLPYAIGVGPASA